MPHVATGALFCGKIVVVLRDRGLKHRRAKIRSVAQVLRPSVVAQESKAARITASHVDISRVIPALRRVLEKIDRADRETDCAIRASRCGRRSEERRVGKECRSRRWAAQ